MTKLETSIDTVLQQLKPELAAETWVSRRRYFNQMLKLAKSMGIDEPCQKLYDAFVADDNGSKERRELHIRCVKLIDAAAGTGARDGSGILYNEQPLPGKAETLDYFRSRHCALSAGASIDHLIVKAEIEMQHLGLSESTAGQYRHAWIDIRRHFYKNETSGYGESLVQDYLREADSQRNSGSMKYWKWKMNRKAAHVLTEVARTGTFQWSCIGLDLDCSSMEIESIRAQYLNSLRQRNLSKSTIDLHDYVFRKAMAFIGAETQNDISSLSAENIQPVIISFAGICSSRSMATIIPILRSLLVYLHKSGFAGKDLSGTVMSAFVQRGSVACYLSEKDQAELAAQLDSESSRLKAIVLLALKLGLRDFDICNLTFQQIDWQNDKIRLNQKKTGEPLVLPLLPAVGNALMDYIMNERPKREDCYPYVFLREQAPHNKLASVYPACSSLFKRKEIKPVNGTALGAHLLRYTLVYRLLKAKVPHQVITDALGHTSKEADKPYLSMEESMLRMCALDLSAIGCVSWKEGGLND